MAGRVHPAILGEDVHTRNGQEIFKPKGQNPKPDPDVTKKENTDIKQCQDLYNSQLSPSDLQFPNRPGFAEKGNPTILRANLFELHLVDGRQIFPYKADVDQRLHKSKRYLRDFFCKILKGLPELTLMGHGVVTDYVSLLITSARIDLGPTNTKTYAIPFHDYKAPSSKVEAGTKPFKLTLTLLQPISSADLPSYVGSNPSVLSAGQIADSEITRALNIIIAGHPSKDQNVYQGGQNSFFRYPSDPSVFSKYDLLGGLIAVRGYFYSVRFATLRVLLNVHGVCNPFYKATNARGLMQEFEDLGGKPHALMEFFRMVKIMTSYTKGPNNTFITKVKTIIDLSEGSADNTKFNLTRVQSKITVSVAQYFKTEYGIELKYPGKRLFNCGTIINPVWIPAELCTVIPGQRYLGELNSSQTTRMLTIAARPPGENAKRIVAEDGGLGLIGVLPEMCETLTAFGIRINPDMVVVDGRVLTSPQPKYGGKSGNASVSAKNGAWNMSGKTFSRPASMPSWTLLRVGATAKIPLPDLKLHIQALTNIFDKMGLKTKIPKGPGPAVDLPRVSNDDPSMNKSVVDGYLEKVFRHYKQEGIAMFLVLLPTEDAWLFNRIKFWGDVVTGIHTCCVQMSKIKKENINISANLALKVNLKLGGINQRLDPAVLEFLSHGNTMVVGLDVTHPKPGSVKGTPSIAGIVASTDSGFTQWPGNIRAQTSRQEMISNLDVLMEERLKLWVSSNPNHKLENIMVYRDGVSDSQFETVLREEVPAIRKACAKVLDNQPNITCIVAVKRHHTRFYPTDAKGADPSHKNNIKNGTVVDRGITVPKRWDFFMAPHVALQGTTKPAHYYVILDEIRDATKLGADHLEQITHNLCYLHGTTTSAVSICPPAYYADKICERGRCYLANYISSKKPGEEFDYNESPWHQGVHESIKDSMFYV